MRGDFIFVLLFAGAAHSSRTRRIGEITQQEFDQSTICYGTTDRRA